MAAPTHPKEITTRRFFRLWKETVTIEEPATEQQQQVDDVWAAWEKEQRRVYEMSIAAALDNKPRFAYVGQRPSPLGQSRASRAITAATRAPLRPTTMTGVSACLRSSLPPPNAPLTARETIRACASVVTPDERNSSSRETRHHYVVCSFRNCSKANHIRHRSPLHL